MHILAPELLGESSPSVSASSSSADLLTTPTTTSMAHQPSPASDIYAFGVVALEMAVLGINVGSCGHSSTTVDREHSNSINSSTGVSSSSCFLSSSPSPLYPSRETLLQMVDQLDNPLQRDFIRRCMAYAANDRPTARELLFHPVVFEVPRLELLCVNRLLNSNSVHSQPESLVEEVQRRRLDLHCPLAEIPCRAGNRFVLNSNELNKFTAEHVEKFVEEVRNGAHPLYAIERRRPAITNSQAAACGMQRSSSASTFNSPSHTPLIPTGNKLINNTIDHNGNQSNGHQNQVNQSNCSIITSSNEPLHSSSSIDDSSSSPLCPSSRNDDQQMLFDETGQPFSPLPDSDQPLDFGMSNEFALDSCVHCADFPYTEESRRILAISINVQSIPCEGQTLQAVLSIRLRLDDQMNRQLTCELSELDSPLAMADELVFYGFIHPVSQLSVHGLLSIHKIDRFTKVYQSFLAFKINQINLIEFRTLLPIFSWIVTWFVNKFTKLCANN